MEICHDAISRRTLLRLIGASAMGCFFSATARAQSGGETFKMLTRPIPSSGEKLPIIGLGTWQTFDVDPTESAALASVLGTIAGDDTVVVVCNESVGGAVVATDLAGLVGL